jgi:hypothetical protein
MYNLTRRGFLRLSAVGLPVLLSLGGLRRLFAGEREHVMVNHWRGGTFAQTNVNMERYAEGFIRAQVDGRWGEYSIRELPEDFIDWNISSRLEVLEKISRGEMPTLGGPHSASIASYGGGRLDTAFTINNAVKGLGFVPKRERIVETIERLNRTMERGMSEKLEILKGIYTEKDLLDLEKQVSLELYTEEGFETHTFLNLMSNPSVSIVFLDIPSYEIRAVVRLVHPEDQSASEEERNIVRYSNLVHDYFHGKAPRKSIGMIFHVIEVFDNSPMSRGVRVVPA